MAPERIDLIIAGQANHEERLERLEAALYDLRARVNLIAALLVANLGGIVYLLATIR